MTKELRTGISYKTSKASEYISRRTSRRLSRSVIEKAEGEEIFLAGRKIFWFWGVCIN